MEEVAPAGDPANEAIRAMGEVRDEVCLDIALDVVNISLLSQTKMWVGMTKVSERSHESRGLCAFCGKQDMKV